MRFSDVLSEFALGLMEVEDFLYCPPPGVEVQALFGRSIVNCVSEGVCAVADNFILPTGRRVIFNDTLGQTITITSQEEYEDVKHKLYNRMLILIVSACETNEDEYGIRKYAKPTNLVKNYILLVSGIHFQKELAELLEACHDHSSTCMNFHLKCFTFQEHLFGYSRLWRVFQDVPVLLLPPCGQSPVCRWGFKKWFRCSFFRLWQVGPHIGDKEINHRAYCHTDKKIDFRDPLRIWTYSHGFKVSRGAEEIIPSWENTKIFINYRADSGCKLWHFWGLKNMKCSVQGYPVAFLNNHNPCEQEEVHQIFEVFNKTEELEM
uniref:Uncharacterized protein n=1 Tax=Leptobrachium leishanense TaxID=445787 RepID=A0A8C5QB43_9ANUR